MAAEVAAHVQVGPGKLRDLLSFEPMSGGALKPVSKGCHVLLRKVVVRRQNVALGSGPTGTAEDDARGA
jgi:hypothetical protein